MQEKPTNPSKRDFAAVIMAAGQGKRMKDPTLAKVMYELNGRPMVHYVVDLAYNLGASKVIIVVGHQREIVAGYILRSHPDAQCVVQEQQLGTGNAVLQAAPVLEGFTGDVIVLSGDVPLLSVPTMQNLIRHHLDTKAVATILTASVDDPTGYGRIIRNSDGSVEKIVEHRDASEEELKIREINSGIYLFDKVKLFDGLAHLNTDNAQHEYYLTDVFEYFWNHHWIVSALVAEHPQEIHGINTFEQLEQAKVIMSSRV